MEGKMGKKVLNIAIVMLLSIVFSDYAWSADRGTINSGETKTNVELTGPSYIDTWNFSANAGDRAIINAVKTKESLDTKIILYPPGGGPAEAQSLCTDIMGFYNGCRDQLDIQLQQTGLYTIVIQDYSINHSGNYNLSLLKMPGTTNADNDLDGELITSGQTIFGAINLPSDFDAYQIYIQSADRVIVSAVTTSGTLDTKIILYPPEGGPVEAQSLCTDIMGFYNGCRDQLDIQLQQTGLYTIVIQDYSINHSGDYNVSLTKIPSTVRPGIYNPSPADGTVLNTLLGAFSWNVVTGATGYDLYFREDGIDPLEKIGDNLLSPVMAFPYMEKGNKYSWHVVAHTPGGDIQGPVWWFNVSEAETSWSEDFESYTSGDFPFSGGWYLFYDGGNQSQQYIDSSHSATGIHSLHLTGVSTFPAGVCQRMGYLSEATLEASIFIDHIPSCDSFAVASTVNLRDQKSGATFGGIRFGCDGNIYAVRNNLTADFVLLIPYVTQKWYNMRLVLNMNTMSYDIYIDGSQQGENIEILNPGFPTSFCFFAGTTTNVWVDDVEVIVLQEAQQYAVTVEKSGTGLGTVTSNPAGISCGDNCSESYDSGTQVTLTATPQAGSTFDGWSGGGCSGTGSCTITLNSDVTVTATFSPIAQVTDYLLTVNKTGTGNGTITSSPKGISCGSDCSETCPIGKKPKKMTLKVKPDANATFLGWGGACQASGVKTSCKLTMDSDKNVTASFGLSDISVSPTSYDFGNVTVKKPSGPVTFTIQNNGTGSLKITKMKVIGTDAKMFKIKGSCKKAITAGGTCQFTVIVNPKSTGLKTATVQITSNDPDTATIDIPLSGTGI
jgi:hypothetical protein